MYRKLEPAPRMTKNEAATRYPDEYFIMRMDNIRNLSNVMGTVLYVGDDGDELFALGKYIEEPMQCVVSEGMHHRRSLGGVVVGT